MGLDSSKGRISSLKANIMEAKSEYNGRQILVELSEEVSKHWLS